MASFSDIQYPIARRDESVVDDYHGVSIADPYRWLEDPEAKEVKEFVEKQTSLTESILGQCETREDLRRSIKNLFDHPRFTTPFKKGNKYFYSYNSGLHAQSVLYVQVKFSNIGWTHDGKGFFYSRYPAPKEGTFSDAGTETNVNLNHEVRYHLLGTDQSEDILCWRDPDHPEWFFVTQIFDDGKYLLLSIRDGAGPVEKLYYCDLSSIEHGLEGFKERNEMLPFIKLVDDFEASYQYVANDESEFTFLTNKNASKQKLVRMDIKKPKKWVDVLPESESDVLKSANAVNGNQLLVCYLSDVKYVMQLKDLESGHQLHDLPIDIGTVHDISCRRKDNEFFIKFTGFLTSGVIYKFKLESGVPEMEIFREIIVPGFDKAEFEAKQVFFPSKDGTKIPMFVVSKKDIQLDGSHPLLLYGYGGFSISLTPYFVVVRIVLMRHLGVVFCLANYMGVENTERNGIKQDHSHKNRIALMTLFLLQNILFQLATPSPINYVLKVVVMVGFWLELALIRDLIYLDVLSLVLVLWICCVFTSLLYAAFYIAYARKAEEVHYHSSRPKYESENRNLPGF